MLNSTGSHILKQQFFVVCLFVYLPRPEALFTDKDIAFDIMAGNPTTKQQRINKEATNPTNFLQKVFNDISLEKDEKTWMSTDDSLTEKRLRLIASFSETQFATQLKLDCVSNAKNGKLSSALREKGNLCYAQGDCEAALRLYNQVNLPLFFLQLFLAHANFFWSKNIAVLDSSSKKSNEKPRTIFQHKTANCHILFCPVIFMKKKFAIFY